MNVDVIKGYWKEFAGAAQEQWGKLTDDDIDEAKGDMLKLEGRLQRLYGYSAEEARLRLSQLADRVSRLKAS